MVECLGKMGFQVKKKFNPKLEEYKHEDLDKSYKCFTLKYEPKIGFFYNFVANIINKNFMITRAFYYIWSLDRDVFKVLKLHSPAARAMLRTLKTSVMSIYHKMHSHSYDFLYLSS